MCNQKHQALFLALLAFLLPSVLKADNVAKVGNVEYETLAAAIAATTGGETVSINKADTYTLPDISKNITVKGEVDGVVFNDTTAGSIASIPNGATFQNVKFTLGNVNYHGFQHAGTINMENCTIDGKLFSYGDMNFTNCQFTQSKADYHMWCYSGNLTYTGCTFTNNATGKFLNIYNEDGATAYKVTVNDSKFVNNAAADKAALNVKATGDSKILQYAVEVNNCTTEGAFPAASSSGALVVLNNLVQVDDLPSTGTDKIVVTQDGEVIYNNGTAVKTMEIGTVEELKAFRDAVNGGNQFKNTKVVLTADLDLSSEENWKPIGNLVAYPGQSFDGTFDGNGHVISNLTVIDNTPNHAVAALFGSVVNGTIKNLTVKNVNIQSTHYAAGIVAYTSYKPTIENCHVIGGTITSTPEIVGTSYDNGDKVGGIMGYATAGSTITGCSVEGVNITGYRDLGGICGYAAGTVTDCTVKNVTITQDDTNGYEKEPIKTVGEVIGRTENTTVNEANTTENVVLKHVGVVAKIGNNTYTTFEAAFAAAQDGQTITLLADCAGNGIKAPQGKFATGITVDFAGHTYTVDGSTVGSTGTETNGFQLLKDNKITFKNGTITSEKAKILIQNYSNLTLEGMTLTMNNTNYTGAYTLSNNNGNIVIDGSTINANPAGGFAFDVCRYSSYPSVNVEVKGESVINGDIEISASGNDAKDGFGLKLTAGTLSGKIVMAPSAAAAMAATPDKVVIAKSAEFGANAPEGYKWVEGEDGVSTLAPIVYVAQIGDKKYETLQAAFDAAEAADPANIEITLLADATLEINAWSGTTNPKTIGTVNTQSITINGNDHKLTFMTLNTDWNNVATMNDAQTKLILNNMTIAQGGKNTKGTWNAYDIMFNSAVELNNVTSERPMAFKNSATLKNVTINDTKDVYAIWISPRVEGQKIEIDGLNVTCGRGIKIDDQYVDNPVLVSLDIQNATFNTAKKAAILVKSAAETTITAGEGIDISNVAADQTNLVWVDEDKAEEYYNVSVEGASLAPEKIAEYVATLVRGEQTRGYYKTFAAAYASTDYADGDTYVLLKNTTETVEIAKVLTIVKNGFTAANVSAAEGYKKTETDEEIAIAEFHPVCKIANVKYETLEEAFAAALDGQTITLLADCAGNGIKAPQGKFATGITVDFAGHTYTVDGSTVGSTGTETNGFQLLKDNKITFKNGTITSEKAKILIQNYSNLTLEGMTLTMNNTNYTGAYTLSNNNGNIVIDGSTINANPAGGFAFDVCRYSSYPSVNVEVKGESVINGDIEISASGNDAKDGFGLKLTAGTLSGKIVMAPSAAAAMAATPDKVVIAKSAEFTAEAPKDYKWVEAESGMQKLVACEYVAQVGEDKYETFEAAAEAAGENVITLLANIEDNYTLASGKTLKVNKNGRTLNVVAAEGSILDETTDGDVTTYTAALASETDIVLVDDEPYTFTADTQVKSATYTRNYAADRVGKFQAWSMPFDFTITEEAAEKFTFYRINMIAHSANPNDEVQNTDQVWIYVAPMKAGEKLTANRPYAYKPKTEGEFTFTADNNKLYAPDYTSRLHTETADHSYDFYATYNTVTPADQGGNFYYLSKKGEASRTTTETTKVGSYRWIVKATTKGGAYYAPRLYFAEDGSETEGIRSISGSNDVEGYYTLGGTRIETPRHGMFVVKYKNGITKKQYIK